MSDTISQRCAEHSATEKEILTRIDVLEENVRELKEILKGKAEDSQLREIVEKTERQIKELKDEISKLNTVNVSHGESLAGILEILKALKETQDLMRADYSMLKDCYTQASSHIASITAILAERARATEAPKDSPAPIPNTETVIEEQGVTSQDPWFVRVVVKNPTFKTAALLFAGAFITFIFTHVNEIFTLLGQIFANK
jgi:DNA repair ATPase RecN